MNTFFVSDATIALDELQLSEDESKHAVRVLRMVEGDHFRVVNGRGLELFVRISAAHPKRCRAEVLERRQAPPLEHRLHLAIAPTKNAERMEWLVEKAVEIGLTDLTFLACKHSEKKVQKMERLEKIAIAAMKQSQGLYLLNMHPMLPFDQFNFGEDEVFIAHCHEGQKTPISAIEGAKNRVFLVGPEGDFSNEEVEIALRKGATALDLGSQRLRTETAGLVCVVHGSSKLEFSL